MFGLVSMVFDLFVNILADLVATLLAGGVVIIVISVAVVLISISPPILDKGGTLQSIVIPCIVF